MGCMTTETDSKGHQWLAQLQAWGQELGFSQIGVSGVDLSAAEPGLQAWLDAGFHGDMHYMQRHGRIRARPAELVPGTLRVITARMNYLPVSLGQDWREVHWQRLKQPGQAVVSHYAQGRDYHKVVRQRLQTWVDRLQTLAGPVGCRVFTDSAPVLEVELATRSGMGWRGKHTLALHRDAGSMFFLGEIFTDLNLPCTDKVSAHCGECTACIDVCPTRAIVAPYQLDARRCISYLTIEHQGSIALELRPLIGQHVYGCDDCQVVCPWNKYAQRTSIHDFEPRNGLQAADLLSLWVWSEADFDQRLQGSPIRRIGYERWQRNLAVASGNALRMSNLEVEWARDLRQALEKALVFWTQRNDMVAEHVAWALNQMPEPKVAG